MALTSGEGAASASRLLDRAAVRELGRPVLSSEAAGVVGRVLSDLAPAAIAAEEPDTDGGKGHSSRL